MDPVEDAVRRMLGKGPLKPEAVVEPRPTFIGKLKEIHAHQLFLVIAGMTIGFFVAYLILVVFLVIGRSELSTVVGGIVLAALVAALLVAWRIMNKRADGL